MIGRLKYISVVAIGAMALSGTAARAQQQPTDSQQEQQPMTPIPAIRSPLASAADNGDEDETPDSQQVIPDTRSLTGAEDLSLGTIPLGHSYWQPRVSVAGAVDSNPGLSSGGGDWGTWASLLGGVDIHRTSGVSDMVLSYTGGGIVSNGGEMESGGIEELAFKDSLSFRRSKLSVFEQLGYLPESSFGFAGTAGSGIPAGGGLTLGNGLTAGESILAPPGQNLTSSTAVEWDTKLSPRSSLTFLGSYALLRYFDDDLADFGDASFQAGYNYQLNRKDTIAISYQFSAYRYSGLDQSINTNTIQGSYGRRITGRLAFQIAAGPQFVSSTEPIVGSTSSSTPAANSVSTLYWSLNSSLVYRLRRAVLAAAYSHGLTGGSGLLNGAETDVVNGTVNQQLSRTFNALWSVGYSRNSGFGVVATSSSTQQNYNYWFAGVTLTHPLGRTMDVFVNYQLQYQTNNMNACVGAACSSSLTRNQVVFGFNLHKQPIPF
ncbi:MAG: hypothetical protein WA192_07345 [Candidatus Acidiferrales bacterium]